MPEVELKENKQLVEGLCRDQYNREILRFFARHPFTRFDKKVLINGLGLSDTHHIELALENLAGQKLLEIKNGPGTPLCWLTKHEPVHSAIKYYLVPRVRKTGENFDRPAMMQLIMPLSPCPVVAASVL